MTRALSVARRWASELPEGYMLRFDEVVLFFVGMVGVILGAVSLAARLDAVGMSLGVIVFAMGMTSLWFGWQSHRDTCRRHARSVRPS